MGRKSKRKFSKFDPSIVAERENVSRKENSGSSTTSKKETSISESEVKTVEIDLAQKSDNLDSSRSVYVEHNQTHSENTKSTHRGSQRDSQSVDTRRHRDHSGNGDKLEENSKWTKSEKHGRSRTKEHSRKTSEKEYKSNYDDEDELTTERCKEDKDNEGKIKSNQMFDKDDIQQDRKRRSRNDSSEYHNQNDDAKHQDNKRKNSKDNHFKRNSENRDEDNRRRTYSNDSGKFKENDQTKEYDSEKRNTKVHSHKKDTQYDHFANRGYQNRKNDKSKDERKSNRIDDDHQDNKMKNSGSEDNNEEHNELQESINESINNIQRSGSNKFKGQRENTNKEKREHNRGGRSGHDNRREDYNRDSGKSHSHHSNQGPTAGSSVWSGSKHLFQKDHQKGLKTPNSTATSQHYQKSNNNYIKDENNDWQTSDVSMVEPTRNISNLSIVERTWNISNMSIADIEGDPLSNKGISKPVMSPSSSSLNPEAVSFHPDFGPPHIAKDKAIKEARTFQNENSSLDCQKENDDSFLGGRAVVGSTPKEDLLEESQRKIESHQNKGSKMTTPNDWRSQNKERRSGNYSGVVRTGNSVYNRQEETPKNSNESSVRSIGRGRSVQDGGRKFSDIWSEGKKTRKSNDWSGDTSNENEKSNSTPGRKSFGAIYATLSFYNVNDEFEDLKNYVKSKDFDTFVRVTEVEQDLFTVQQEYALAHCVAEDMNMGSGIAVEFRRTFKRVPDLLQQRQSQGGLAILEDKERYIYYMVTKKKSAGKPTYATFWLSLQQLRNHIIEHKVEKLAIPRIGCGLDNLEWSIVKRMIEFVFKDTNVEILVCNFQQEETVASPRNYIKKCKIVNVSYPITEIEQGTIIIYFASCDGTPTQTMKDLDGKFKLRSTFTSEKRTLGQPIRLEDRINNYLLYGCVVKVKKDDPFGFTDFNKCLLSIQQQNKKDQFVYVAFQKIEEDEMLTNKILNLMRHTLRDVDIYCCGSQDFRDTSRED